MGRRKSDETYDNSWSRKNGVAINAMCRRSGLNNLRHSAPALEQPHLGRVMLVESFRLIPVVGGCRRPTLNAVPTSVGRGQHFVDSPSTGAGFNGLRRLARKDSVITDLGKYSGQLRDFVFQLVEIFATLHCSPPGLPPGSPPGMDQAKMFGRLSFCQPIASLRDGRFVLDLLFLNSATTSSLHHSFEV